MISRDLHNLARQARIRAARGEMTPEYLTVLLDRLETLGDQLEELEQHTRPRADSASPRAYPANVVELRPRPAPHA